MRRTNNARRGLGIRGQLMFFLCFICLFLLVLFWILPYIFELFDTMKQLFAL